VGIRVQGGLRARLKGKAGDIGGRARGSQAGITAGVARPVEGGGRRGRQVGPDYQRRND
jgi:hypothetical protein